MMKKIFLVVLFVSVFSTYISLHATEFHGVCVGIENYPENPIDYCVDDAEDLKNMLVNEQNWTANNIELLSNSDASETAILDGIDDLPKSSGNTSFFSFAGHGDSEELGERFDYDGVDGLIPYHSSHEDDRLNQTELQSEFGVSYNQYACFLDVCGSGIFPRDMSRGVICSAVEEDELAYGTGVFNNGVFTEYLLSGFNNNAADSEGDDNGLVSAEELFDYTDHRTTNYSSAIWWMDTMHPQMDDNFYQSYCNGELILTKCTSPPSAPSNFRITNEEDNGKHPEMSWNSTDETEYYEVFRLAEEGGGGGSKSSWQLKTRTDNTSYTDNEVTIIVDSKKDGEKDEEEGYTFTYKVRAINNAGSSSYSNTDDIYGEWVPYKKIIVHDNNMQKNEKLPEVFVLHPNYPNPFNPITTISYELPYTSDVSVAIYNLKGQFVEQILNGQQAPGKHFIKWHANHLPSGVYIYKIHALSEQGNEFISMKKMSLMK